MAGAQREASADALEERRLEVVAERVAQVRWVTLGALLVAVAVVWRSAPHALVVAWVVASMIAREACTAVLRRLVANRAAPVAARLRVAVLWSALLGVAYASAALFLPGLDTAHYAALTLILFSLSMGGLTVIATIKGAFTAYAVPMTLILAVMWGLQGTWFGAAVVLLMVLLLSVNLRFARDNRESFEESFRIRQENEALARQLATERDAAEQANREKSRFLAGASHDLRQPLQALTLNSGELVRLPLSDVARAIAGDIGTSVEQLRSMLDALLDLSKLDSGVVVAQPVRVRLALTLQAVVANFRAAAVARGVGLSCHCPNDVTVETDPDLLRRMLANLVDNAIKFTPTGAVRVEANVCEHDVQIAVRDSGPGIAPEHHGLVFEDLVQLPQSGPERPSGHGLGLGIVRRAAALLNTEVQLQSAPGHGAVFRWRLPRATDHAGARAATESVPSLAGQQVLILDDDAMVRGAYANALTGAGALIRTAATIDEALKHDSRADAAVVDARLAEGEDGFGAVQRLRERWPGMPVVIVTADSGQAIAEAARRSGVALLRKPVDTITLAGELMRAIGSSVLRQGTRSAA